MKIEKMRVNMKPPVSLAARQRSGESPVWRHAKPNSSRTEMWNVFVWRFSWHNFHYFYTESYVFLERRTYPALLLLLLVLGVLAQAAHAGVAGRAVDAGHAFRRVLPSYPQVWKWRRTSRFAYGWAGLIDAAVPSDSSVSTMCFLFRATGNSSLMFHMWLFHTIYTFSWH